MPQGSKASYSNKQKRQAAHIEESVKERGGSSKTAARIGWATVNKQDGGAKKKKAKASSTTRKKKVRASATTRKKTTKKTAARKSTTGRKKTRKAA